MRTRVSKKQIERRTYVSTKGSEARPQSQVTLFHDVAIGSGSQTSTVSKQLEHSAEPIVYMGTVTASSAEAFDLLVVKKDGEIQCLDGDKLQEKWTSPASALTRDAISPISNAQVEFAQLTNAYAASQGILKSRQGILSTFSQEISEDGFNPDLLVIITKSEAPAASRNIHVVAMPRRSAMPSNELKNAVEPLLTATFHKSGKHHSDGTLGVHVSSGTVQLLSKGNLTTFDMTGAVPTAISQFRVEESQSFLRLSSTSLMVASGSTITVYSSKFKSTLASIPLPEEYRQEGYLPTNDRPSCPCSLVSYFPKLGTAVAIANTGLVAVQIEGKSRIAGLLIDSLGCSAGGQPRLKSTGVWTNLGLTTLRSCLPSTLKNPGALLKQSRKDMDQAASTGDVLQFEELLAHKLPILNNADGEGSAENGPHASTIDRRWVIYALSKIFTWPDREQGLVISFYPPNVFTWLLGTGNMTIANIELALREEVRESGLDSIPAGELVDAIVEIDPHMDLVFALISANFLGAEELLAAIRRLMESLELFGEGAATRQMLLTNGEVESLENGDIEEQVEALEAEAEADLAMAEYQLGPGSGVRGEALSLALAKLYTCPTGAIVQALQTAYSAQEIVSLIYLLRFELARGAWTSRYLDEQPDASDNETGVPDYSILLISSLLNNCIDAVGAGGWLSGQARLVSGNRFEAEELIASLKLEVSAALEGLEEATYLRGLTSEMVRYGDAVLRAGPALEGPPGKRVKTMDNAKVISTAAQEIKLLPLGLKAEQYISQLRVGAGGEVQERSARDIGRLKSQKVGKYSLERIVV